MGFEINVFFFRGITRVYMENLKFNPIFVSL